MRSISIKQELIEIAERLTDEATYQDAMDELYVRMKIAQGRQAAQNGQVHSHEDVKKRFGQ